MPASSGPEHPNPPIIADFAQLLRGTGSPRVDLAMLRCLWQRADPGWAHSWAGRPRLSEALEMLSVAGVIELPAARGTLWDHGTPRLPLRVGIPANRTVRRALTGPADEPWFLPTLAWVPTWIRTQHPPQPAREDLARVNQWLLATADTIPPEVAREERSLHIFNDEKKLATLTGGALFDQHRLTLAHLACSEPLGTLRAARLAPRGPVLVVENKSTFDSAWRALRSEHQPGYAAVIFGSGDAVSSLIPDLAALGDLLHVHATRFDYAGDVDIAGVAAARAFLYAAWRSNLPARMATALWDAVASAEPTGPDPSANEIAMTAALASADECGLPESVLNRLASGLRVPQERIDRTALADTGWWTTPPASPSGLDREAARHRQCGRPEQAEGPRPAGYPKST